MRHLERPMAFSTNAKFQVIRFEFDSITSLDDCIDELVEQSMKSNNDDYLSLISLEFLRTHQWPNEQQSSTKYLLYFANIQNSVGTDVLNLLLNGESVSNTCQKISHSTEEDSSNDEYKFSIIYVIYLIFICIN